MLPLGTGDGIKRDEFSENFRRGGEGYHFNQKIDTAAFGLVNRAVVHVI